MCQTPGNKISRSASSGSSVQYSDKLVNISHSDSVGQILAGKLQMDLVVRESFHRRLWVFIGNSALCPTETYHRKEDYKKLKVIEVPAHDNANSLASLFVTISCL